MSNVYVPWPQRPPAQLRGPAKIVAALAIVVYRIAGPVVRRFPGLLFSLATVGACLFVWLFSLLFRGITQVQRFLLEADLVRDKWQYLSIEQIARGAGELGLIWPAWLLWPFQWLVLRDVVAILGVLGFVSVLAMFAIWWERKVAGRMQSRMGPMRVGGWHGWSQSLADGIKLVGKEDLIPDQADRPLFRLAPYLAFVPALAAFLALPFGVYWIFRDLDVALLLILALLGIEVMGVLVAGWASNNKWSVFGAMREACQVVSYEIPMGMSLLVPVMVAESLRLHAIVDWQAGGMSHWLGFHSPWTFLAMFTYFVASLASCKRAPFDLPEAESELVAGFHTEYSGMRWALFFFAEYAAMFIVAAVLVILFLGGWDAPWAGLAKSSWAQDTSLLGQLFYGVVFSGPLWFVAKSMFIVYVQIWLRWTLPRLRIDQVLYSCVQVILPLTMATLLASSLWELAAQRFTLFSVFANAVSLVLTAVGVLMGAGILFIAAYGLRNRTTLVGSMANVRPLAGG